MNNINQTIQVANLFKNNRIAAGLTQEDLAQQAQINRQNVLDLESGKNVGLYIIVKIMAILDLEIGKHHQNATSIAPEKKRVRNITIDASKYPQLKMMLWDRREKKLKERDAFYIYEKNIKFIDNLNIEPSELKLIQNLTKKFGNGVML
ncbi:MAG: helix-turn-helix domain-containing protein [Methylotenera sp.]|nr:helix-turn-helix domain-containing protein [Methylotenera sp.]